MKTGISLPDALYDSAARTAKRRGLSRSELYRRVLQAFLREHDDARITAKLNDVYDKVLGGHSECRKLDPTLNRIQTQTLVDSLAREEL